MNNRSSISAFGLPATATLLACPHCNYVAGLAVMSSRVSQPCPNCARPGTRLLFPDVSGGELLRMIESYWVRASAAVSETNQQLADSVTARTGRAWPPEQVVGIAREVQSVLSRARSTSGQNALYTKTLALVRKRLGLESDEDVQAAWILLASYSDAQDDHKVVATLTHTLLETLLDNLLVTQLAAAGTRYDEAEDAVEALRTFTAQEEQFEALAHVCLRDAMAKTTHPWFYFGWQDVRKRRNRFLHGEPFAIGQRTAQQAYKLAQHAVSMFAQLQNIYGLRAVSREVDDLEEESI